MEQMETEQGLYAQVVILNRKDFNTTEANRNENEDKLKFQGQSSISQRWLDLDFYWIGEMFCTREPDFYRKIYQRHEKT